MAKKDFMTKLLESRKFECSPVAFLPEMLRKFFAGEMDETNFKKIFEDKSTQAKVYLVYMGKKNIEANQIVFRHEFRLADEVNAAIYRDNLSGTEFKDRLKEVIIAYNKAAQ
ncbi:MAG: hypothetical protein IJ774_02930 [Selenomonadaceae bacterium]|nr:hypothetical protein [Selenomonadaceae bacterium]